MTVIDLKTIREQKAQAERAPVMIERVADPACANRVLYRLTSASRASIQAEMNYITAQAESFGNGLVLFFGPYCVARGEYCAAGFVVVAPDA